MPSPPASFSTPPSSSRRPCPASPSSPTSRWCTSSTASIPTEVQTGARHPRGNLTWPEVGIFAQRAKARPNRLGVSVCRLDGVDGLTLAVSGLDAIDATPAMDVKPYLAEFAPRGDVRQPRWSHELMARYWS